MFNSAPSLHRPFSPSSPGHCACPDRPAGGGLQTDRGPASRPPMETGTSWGGRSSRGRPEGSGTGRGGSRGHSALVIPTKVGEAPGPSPAAQELLAQLCHRNPKKSSVPPPPVLALVLEEDLSSAQLGGICISFEGFPFQWGYWNSSGAYAGLLTPSCVPSGKWLVGLSVAENLG